MHCEPARAVWRSCLALFLLASSAVADEWPQWRGPQRDGVWRETGLVEKFSGPRLKRRWTSKIGSGYSGPTVAGGKVYVTDRLLEPVQVERIHCFDWENGKPLWNYVYPCVYRGVGYEAGPRASVTIDEGLAYSLGAMGHLNCLNAEDGAVVWQKDLNELYKIRMPIWGIAASPLVEQGLVIVQIGGEEACIVAFDKKTGQEKWRALADDASYSAPIMIEQAGKRVLVCWTGARVVGLNPLSGEVYWQHPFQPTRMVIAIATPVVQDNRLFVSSFYDGSLMLKLDPERTAIEPVWRRLGPDEMKTDSLHCMIGTPYLEGDYVYGVDSYGELRCLDAETGDRIWKNQKATPRARWSTIHMVRNGDKTWMFNERGDLIVSKLSPEGYEEISRTKLISPTQVQLPQRGGVCWAHPAFAYKHVFARNDEELVAADLSAE